MEFASRVEEDCAWSQVAKAKLRKGLVGDAIELFIRVADATHFLEVIKAAEGANIYHDLVKYLLIVRNKTKEPEVDSEFIYAYAKIGRLGEIEEFILMPNVSNLLNVGDRLYSEAHYGAAVTLSRSQIGSIFPSLFGSVMNSDTGRNLHTYMHNMIILIMLQPL